MSTQPLEQAISSTRSVLAGVKKDQLASATPCQSWNVSQLVDHIVGGQYSFAAMVNGEPLSGEARTFADGDFLADFDKGSAECLAAFGAPGVMDRVLKLPFGEMPGSRFVGLATVDTFVHGWDLAKATGQKPDFDPELAGALLDGSRQAIQEAFRGPDGQAPFGPEQKAPAGASNADQLAAFLGRTV
jgi:uncharacterized protein (TIGR03086 family)